ncbi:MAG: CBS domain-containing protein [Candidatus Hecatellaceae archaeon]
MSMTIVARVRDAMDTNVVMVDASAKVIDVLNAMLEKKVWSVVVEKEGLPVGVITERDILRRCIAKKLLTDVCTAEEIMSSPLITISPDESIMEAMKLMAMKKVRRLFVVEEGKIIGRVTQTGLMTYILNVILTLHDLGIRL